ncbi:MAG: 50S ribosomal protein L28 [Candidatus Sumerlaeia bacterium]|nr:50S ribosomal protein L28 [Candidatus Sumerlaeia bacterium]
MAHCLICGKTTEFGHNVSHSRRRTKRTFRPNLQRVKIRYEGKVRRAFVCTRCLKANKVEKVI